jgi:hypothetical protein
MISRKKTEILTEMTVDNHCFQVTTNPFDRGRILNFIVKYITNSSLRAEIERKKFEKKLMNMNHSYFARIERRKITNQEAAYRDMFELDQTIDKHDLGKRMKMLVRKFHPDVGGDDRIMTIINEAYTYLSEKAV